MILVIDNYDSFTYNVVQYLGELGAQMQVSRNDEISLDEISRLAPDKIVISPGPCSPSEAGISVPCVERFAGEIPILGICLGHQSIGQAFGGEVLRATDIMHGKTSPIHHEGKGVFADLPSPFQATRYHSLIVGAANLPDCFEVTAWTEKDGERDEIMGMRHRTLDVEGVQFHPESLFTEVGKQLLGNFLNAHSRRAA
ncbi:MAG: aminodeoxychorismate/anthranilate synthase component II [Pseudomonadaceae bacterium]|nr:aminodeoxychorismate/anthranilate synthase component II [Pseudomonadaceae bacterium]